MKKSILFLLLFSLISISKLRAQTYGLDNADPAVFTKFKVPDTDLRSLWFNTGLSFSSIKEMQVYYYHLNNYNSNFNYNLNPTYYLLNESDDRYLNLSASLSAAYNGSYSESDATGSYYANTSRQNSYSGILNVNFTLNNYINPENVFYSLGSSVNVQMQDSKEERSSGTTVSSYFGTKNQNYNFSFGLGIGKLRNVTSVVSAIRFQERLKQLNMLNGNLNEATIESLAQQFYKQTYYGQVYDRPDKFFWQGIEKTLSADGISLNGLNMYADNYLRETVNEVRFIRHEGFIAGADVQLNYQNNYESNHGILLEQFYTLGNLYLDFSHQMDLNSQLSFNISVSGGPNILSDHSVTQQYLLNTAAGYSYELTDRIVTSLSDSFTLLHQNGKAEYRNYTNILSFSLNYFIEDNFSLNTSYTWNYNDSKYLSTTEQLTQIYNSLNAGFTFYFERGFLYK